MKSPVLRHLVVLLGMLVCCATSAEAATYSAKVVAVVDGDTVDVMHDGAKERIILYGIDCPELNQDFGQAARKYSDDQCYGKVVSIDEYGKDKHNRTIAVVSTPDGINLNQQLVKNGLAWWSKKYAPNDEKLKNFHNAAKVAHTGLWSDPAPVPPWIFRNGQRSVQAQIKQP